MPLKKFILFPIIFIKYGTFLPEVTQTPVTGQRIAINPRDQRAFKKLVMDFIRGRESTPMRFWRDHVSHLNKPLCLDIGANYGECFANATDYEYDCIAIEANPILLPHLEKTRSIHNNSDRIHLVNLLLSDRNEDSVPFYFSDKWTGGGSAAVQQTGSTKISVRSRTLTDIIAEFVTLPVKTIMFKADVEGYEGRGLIPLFLNPVFENIIGILEFDTAMLKAAGTPPEEFFRIMNERYHVFLTGKRSTTLIPVADWDDLRKHWQKSHFHCDLVVCSDLKLLAEDWKPAPQQHS